MVIVLSAAMVLYGALENVNAMGLVAVAVAIVRCGALTSIITPPGVASEPVSILNGRTPVPGAQIRNCIGRNPPGHCAMFWQPLEGTLHSVTRKSIQYDPEDTKDENGAVFGIVAVAEAFFSEVDCAPKTAVLDAITNNMRQSFINYRTLQPEVISKPLILTPWRRDFLSIRVDINVLACAAGPGAEQLLCCSAIPFLTG
jgi:hypothetical protein